MEARNQRMLEELLKQPGNDSCADCHSPAPRWASVNLGIFLCVGCASVHRKLGTHKSRVKSVTLDTWSRDQISNMRQMGNAASNAVWNPNEALHPPPSSWVQEERDSEIEKYIRRKYEQGAFKGGAAARLDGRAEPTSLNRARERDGRLQYDAHVVRENARNPELNDIVLARQRAERDLPPLPAGAGAGSGRSPAPPRSRPVRSGSSQNLSPWSNAGTSTSTSAAGSTSTASAPEANLIDMGPGTSSTLPLQVDPMHGIVSNGYLSAHSQPQQPQQQQQQHGYSTSPLQSQGLAFGSSYSSNGSGVGVGPGVGMSGSGFNSSPMGMYGTQLSPQPTYGQQPSPQTYGHQVSPQMQAGYGQFPAATPSPSFTSTGTFGSSPAIQTPTGYPSAAHSPGPGFGQSQGQVQFIPQQQFPFSQQNPNMGYAQTQTHQPYAAKPPPGEWSGPQQGQGLGVQGYGQGVQYGMGGYGYVAHG